MEDNLRRQRVAGRRIARRRNKRENRPRKRNNPEGSQETTGKPSKLRVTDPGHAVPGEQSNPGQGQQPVTEDQAREASLSGHRVVRSIACYPTIYGIPTALVC